MIESKRLYQNIKNLNKKQDDTQTAPKKRVIYYA